MRMSRTLPVIAGITALALLGLTACGEGDDTGSPSATPTVEPTDEVTSPAPEETEEPVNISSIVIDKDSVYVTVSEGGILVDIPFTTDPVTAAAQLSEAIDLEPITTVTPPASCGGDLTRTTWGAITFVSPYASAPPGAQFYATSDAEKTSNGITVAMTGGQWVGYDGASTLAAYPGAELDFGMSGMGSHVIAYDVASGSDGPDTDNFYGGIAVIQDGAVESFSSPIHYWYDC